MLLHISDIHFRAPECTGENDPNRAYRTRMIQDAKVRARELGGVDAILVGGDIAFRGVQSEYVAASMWLEQLARESSCPLERIFVVPGNHDIDRSRIRGSRQIRNIHKAIKDAAPAYRFRELQEQLAEAATEPADDAVYVLAFRHQKGRRATDQELSHQKAASCRRVLSGFKCSPQHLVDSVWRGHFFKHHFNIVMRFINGARHFIMSQVRGYSSQLDAMNVRVLVHDLGQQHIDFALSDTGQNSRREEKPNDDDIVLSRS